MPPISALCTAAKLGRATFNNLRTANRTASWGDEHSESFAVRLGLFSAFKSCGFLTPAAVDYADELASKPSLPRWYVGNPLDDEKLFLSSNVPTMTVGSLLGLVDDDAGEWVDDSEPVRKSVSPPAQTLVVIDLHSVRARMLALFNK